jgi:hypothetical protein
MTCRATNILFEIKTAKRFSLLIGCVALGASFRMSSRMVQLERDESGLGVYGGRSELIAFNYTRVACAAALQILSVSTLTALIGHLGRQQNLIYSTRSTCPKVADTI